MSKAHQFILSDEEDYQRLWKTLKWVREQPQLYTVFVRASAMRDQYQNRHWWAMMRNLQWASGGQYTALQWHNQMAVNVLGIDYKQITGELTPIVASALETLEAAFAAQAIDAPAYKTIRRALEQQQKQALPWSTQQLDPEEFHMACLLVDAEARMMFRDYGLGPNEVAL